MDLTEAIRSRRMVRSFSGAPVDPAVLGSLLDLAGRAPSAGNAHGRAFVVLEGPDEAAFFWDAATTPEWRDRSRRWPGLSRAPVVVVVLTRPLSYVERYSEPDKAASGLGAVGHQLAAGGESAWAVPYWFFDAGASVMALLLGATAAGLGGCLLGNFRGEDRLLGSLGVPPGWRYAGAVLLGEPGGDDPKSGSLRRGKASESQPIHRGRWNQKSSLVSE
jgi:nitroreductase